MNDMIETEERDHSDVGASGMSRWSICPGSVQLARKVASMGATPDTSSEFADEGTAAHEIAARCLQEGADAWEFMGTKVTVGGREFTVDADMVENVQVFLDAVRETMGPHDEVMVEAHVAMPEYHPGIRGTADALVLHRRVEGGSIWAFTLFDLKYGQGVAVEGQGNKQLRYYAAAAWFTLGDRAQSVSMVTMKIVQPRMEHDQGYVRGEALTVGQLGEWLETELLPAVKRTEEPNAPCVAGDHCQFCPVALYCREIQGPFAEMLETAKALPEDEAKDHEAFIDTSSEALAKLAEAIPLVKRAIKAIEREVFARLQKGDDVPGFKLVAKRADRAWKDGAEELLQAMFGDAAFNEPKLKSPAQIEKIKEGGKEFVAENAYKPEAGLTFAPASDKRDAAKARTAEAVFANI
jgi:hypothetical protein